MKPKVTLGDIPKDKLYDLGSEVIGTSIKEASRILGISKIRIHIKDNYAESYHADLDRGVTLGTFIEKFNNMNSCLKQHKHGIMDYKFDLYLDEDGGLDGTLTAKPGDAAIHCTYAPSGSRGANQLFNIVSTRFAEVFMQNK